MRRRLRPTRRQHQGRQARPLESTGQQQQAARQTTLPYRR